MKPSPRPLGSGTVKILPHRPRNIPLYPVICSAHLSKDEIGLLPVLVFTSFVRCCNPCLRGRASLRGFVFLPLETVFSEVSKLLTVITLDSLLICHFPPSSQESFSRGERWFLPRGVSLVWIFILGYVKAYLLALLLFIDCKRMINTELQHEALTQAVGFRHCENSPPQSSQCILSPCHSQRPSVKG